MGAGGAGGAVRGAGHLGLVVLPPLLVTPGTDLQARARERAGQQRPGVGRSGTTPASSARADGPSSHDGIVATLDKVTKKYGCGRAMWEYNADENRFGTPEALMLLPNYTNGCVDSMEGLLFESATTTPYHFINQAELSVSPSEAMVPSTTGIVYGPVNVPLGIQHLQLLGVKYFMAVVAGHPGPGRRRPGPDSRRHHGAVDTRRTRARTSITTWKIYLVHDSPLVAPLTETPDVLTGVGAAQPSWLPVAQRWYADPASWSQQMVAGGLGVVDQGPRGRGARRSTTALPGGDGVGHPLHRRPGELPRQPGGGARAGARLVLPVVARHRGRRARGARSRTSWWS